MGNPEEAFHRCQGLEPEPDRRRVLGSHHGDFEPQAEFIQLHDQDPRQGQDHDQEDPQRRIARQEEAAAERWQRTGR
eukprot:6111109-Heterocapsa_arctica.AAC.1